MSGGSITYGGSVTFAQVDVGDPFALLHDALHRGLGTVNVLAHLPEVGGQLLNALSEQLNVTRQTAHLLLDQGRLLADL